MLTVPCCASVPTGCVGDGALGRFYLSSTSIGCVNWSCVSISVGPGMGAWIWSSGGWGGSGFLLGVARGRMQSIVLDISCNIILQYILLAPNKLQ